MNKLAILLLLAAAPASGKVVAQEVEYAHEGTVLQGFFAYDDSIKGPRPAVMVVHEWWGHGPYVRRRARMLAELGYLAFAIDMYGKGKYAETHEEAKKLVGLVRGDHKLLRGRARAGLARMLEHEAADPGRAAAIGYCFGGTSVLELARAGAELKGVVSFHGGLDTDAPAKKGEIKAKISVHHGGSDHGVGKAIPAFEKEMTEAGADWTLTSYGGALHGFTVKERPEVYDEAADRRSWAAMRAFFEEIF